ncbi:MAG: hypothetical protein K2Q03_08280 [Sphingobacteriaceae bacterium]|nr:hypothetical protein [Sphingobacteriaceae bacterium]
MNLANLIYSKYKAMMNYIYYKCWGGIFGLIFTFILILIICVIIWGLSWHTIVLTSIHRSIRLFAIAACLFTTLALVLFFNKIWQKYTIERRKYLEDLKNKVEESEWTR